MCVLSGYVNHSWCSQIFLAGLKKQQQKNKRILFSKNSSLNCTTGPEVFFSMSQNSTQYLFTVYHGRMPVLFWLFCLVPLSSLLQPGLKSWWCAPPCVVHFSSPWPFHGPRTIPNIHSCSLTPPCLTLYTFFSSPRPWPSPSAPHLPLSHSVSRTSSHSDIAGAP